MCLSSKGAPVNWMKIMQEMPRLIACKSLLHVKKSVGFEAACVAYISCHCICNTGLMCTLLDLNLSHLWDVCVTCAITTNSGTPAEPAQETNPILKVKKQLIGSMPIHVCVSGPDLVWKKHHGHKVGLKQTPLQGYHPSPWTCATPRLDLSPRLDKNTSV